MKIYWKGLEDVFCLRLQKTSWSRRIRLSHTSSEDVFKTSWSRPIYSSWPYVFKMSCKIVFKTYSRWLQDVVKTSSRHLQDVLLRSLRRFQDVSSSQTVLVNTLSRSIQHVFEMYSKDGYLYSDLPRSHYFWEIYGQCTKSAREIKISQVLVFHFNYTF